MQVLPPTDQAPRDSNAPIEEIKRLELQRQNLIDELKLRNKLLQYYQEAAFHKAQFSSSWSSFTRFLRGKQWPDRRPTYKVSAVLNFLLENIERKNALLTDTKPIPQVTPTADKFQDTADILNIICRHIFQSSQFDQSMVTLVDFSQVLGSGFTGTLWQKDEFTGRGDVYINSYDPRAVYFDPLVLQSYHLHMGEYVIVEDVWPVERARDEFPERADQIKADPGLDLITHTDEGQTFQKLVEKRLGQKGGPSSSAVPRTYIREYYLRDRQRDSNKKFVFTKGCRKVTMAGSCIVDDGPNPYNDGMFPIDMYSWHIDYDTAWGWGDVELLKNPQEIQNKLLSLIVENLMLMSNAIWIGDSDALDKKQWDQLNNAPGKIIKKRPGRELRREQGVAIPPHVFEAVRYIESSDEKISGLVDVMRGIRTGQVSSGVGIESLQFMAQALIRLRARALESMQARIGRKLISRVFQFYDTERIMKFIEANERDDETPSKVYSTELIKPINERRFDAWSDVVFRIEPGSSLAIAKQQKEIRAFRLRELEVIDDRALLEDIEYPHREAVMKRVEQKRQDAANQELAAQQGQAGGGQFPNQEGGSPAGRF